LGFLRFVFVKKNKKPRFLKTHFYSPGLKLRRIDVLTVSKGLKTNRDFASVSYSFRRDEFRWP